MSEQKLSLDGVWEFQADPGDALAVSQIQEWRSVVVPGPWQAQFDDLHNTSGNSLVSAVALPSHPNPWLPAPRKPPSCTLAR